MDHPESDQVPPLPGRQNTMCASDRKRRFGGRGRALAKALPALANSLAAWSRHGHGRSRFLCRLPKSVAKEGENQTGGNI